MADKIIEDTYYEGNSKILNTVDAMSISHSEVETSFRKSSHCDCGLEVGPLVLPSGISSKICLLRPRKRTLDVGELVGGEACPANAWDVMMQGL